MHSARCDGEKCFGSDMEEKRRVERETSAKIAKSDEDVVTVSGIGPADATILLLMLLYAMPWRGRGLESLCPG